MDANLHECFLALTTGQWITAFFFCGLLAVALTIGGFVLVDHLIHKARLRRMQRETMEARQRYAEVTRRARFLP